MWLGLLIMLGLGALALGIWKAAGKLQGTVGSATGGIDMLAKRVEADGILKSLFPKGGIFSGLGGGSNDPASRPGGYEDPAAWGRLGRDLTSAGLDIAKAVQRNRKEGLAPVTSNSSSRDEAISRDSTYIDDSSMVVD